jgi:hypothetical protein
MQSRDRFETREKAAVTAPPEDVFRCLADLENWLRPDGRYVVEPAPEGVGSC